MPASELQPQDRIALAICAIRELKRPRSGPWSAKAGWRKIPHRSIDRLKRRGLVDIIEPAEPRHKHQRTRITARGVVVARSIDAVRS